MIRTSAISFALLLLPTAAAAQDQGFGLDLTEEETPPAEESTGLDLSDTSSSDRAPPAPTPSDEPRKPIARESLLEGERDVTVEDRVKSVQRKVYSKKGRFELAPFITASVNDPYYTKWGASVRAAYFLADSLAIAARGSFYSVNGTDDVRVAKKTFQSRIFNSVPQWSVMGDVEWSPVYGKIAIWNDILHLDGYLLGGIGAVNTETSSLPDRGLNPAFDLGAGVRAVAKDFIAFNVALINTSYVDAPTGTTKGALQNVMTLNAGVSIFFPLKSTGREAE
ncbi:MAG: outer membrane beta-barrel domain-containing protein [Myxococcaceae bacterium]